jgi:hypothetical protein
MTKIPVIPVNSMKIPVQDFWDATIEATKMTNEQDAHIHFIEFTQEPNGPISYRFLGE